MIAAISTTDNNKHQHTRYVPYARRKNQNQIVTVGRRCPPQW